VQPDKRAWRCNIRFRGSGRIPAHTVEFMLPVPRVGYVTATNKAVATRTRHAVQVWALDCLAGRWCSCCPFRCSFCCSQLANAGDFVSSVTLASVHRTESSSRSLGVILTPAVSRFCGLQEYPSKSILNLEGARGRSGYGKPSSALCRGCRGL